MLLVKTYTAPSRIQGTGVFAAESIPKGTRIWEFGGRDFEVADEDLGNPMVVGLKVREGRDFILHFGYKDKQTRKYVVCVDDAMYFNHSSDPNTDNTTETTIAKRDIAKGEELTCDYFEFDDDAAWKLRHIAAAKSSPAGESS